MSRKPYNPTPRRLALTARRVDYGCLLAIRALRDRFSQRVLVTCCLHGVKAGLRLLLRENCAPRTDPVSHTPPLGE